MSTDNTSDEMGGRVKVHEIRCKSIVAEIYEKRDNGKVYYDFELNRSFYDGGEVGLEPYLQQRDIRNAVRLLMDLADWISDAHRSTRQSNRDKDAEL